MATLLSDEEYYAGLPRKVVSAGALIRDEAGRVLLVNPTYKSGWDIPGGVVEHGEGPRVSCARELVEELALPIHVGRLLLAAYHHAKPPVPEALSFLFDGGVLDATTAGQIRLPADELSAYAFVAPEDLPAHCPPRLLVRLEAGLEALACGQTLFTE